MGAGSLKVVWVPPGGFLDDAVLKPFAKAGGLITGFEEARLRTTTDVLAESAEVEVLPFRSVFLRIARLAGVQLPRIAPATLLEAAVRGALLELEVDDDFYLARGHHGTASAIAHTIAELDDHFFPWDDVARVEIADVWLAPKMRTLAKIVERVDQRLEQSRLVRWGSAVQNLRDQPSENLPNPPRLLIFLDDAHTKLRTWLISWAADLGCDITLVAEREDGFYEETNATLLHLGLDLEGSTVGTPKGFAGALTSGVPTQPLDWSVTRYPDPVFEADWAVRRALDWVGQGRDPHEIAILTRSSSTTAPLLRAASQRLGLRLACVSRLPLLSNALVQLVLATLDGIVADDPRVAAKISRSSYLRLPVANQRALDEAATVAMQEGKGWDGLPSEIPWMQRLLEWRAVHAGKFMPYYEWVNVLRDLVEVLEDPTQDFHRGPTSERDSRAQTRARETLITHIQANEQGKELRSLREFALLCRSLWENATTTPDADDEGVRVVRSSAELGGVSALIVLGLAEGSFPGRRREDPVLGDEERNLLNDAFGLELPISHAKVRRDRDELGRVLCAADCVHCSFPAAEEGASREVSPTGLLVGLLKRHERSLFVHPRARLLPDGGSERPADLLLREALGHQFESDQVLINPDEHLHRHGMREPFRISELRDALACPFLRVVDHQVDLNTERPGPRYHELTRLPGMAKLHLAQDEGDARRRLETAAQQWLASIQYRCDEMEHRLLEVAAGQRIDGWLKREFVARQTWPRTILEDGWRGSHMGVSLSCEAILHSEIDGRPIIRITRVAEPNIRDEGVWFDYVTQIHLLKALLKPALYPAVEVETVGAERFLVFLNFPQRWPKAPGLKFVELDLNYQREQDAAAAMKEVHGPKVKQSLKLAKSLDAQPIPGDHCRRCQFGELCRRHQDYGESSTEEEMF